MWYGQDANGGPTLVAEHPTVFRTFPHSSHLIKFTSSFTILLFTTHYIGFRSDGAERELLGAKGPLFCTRRDFGGAQ